MPTLLQHVSHAMPLGAAWEAFQLEATLAENAGLHAHLVMQAREAGIPR